MTGPYDDILTLPHHVSPKHPPMGPHERAAQFSPFAALTGHSEALEETARVTQRKLSLDETRIEALNRALSDAADSGEPVVITYFVPDPRKEGGAYVTTEGSIRRADPIAGVITLQNGTVIPMEDLFDLSPL